ncbi:MAG: hypothetical protein Q8R79_00635 [Legionellaceae bacterium]|nr:hypothetical protein [Legionellaceae bacterium]
MPAPFKSAQSFLFHYLVSELNLPVTVDNRGSQYVMVELQPLQKPRSVTWAECHHHLTVYKTYDKDAGVFNVMHYSAYFKNTKGDKQYRVHVHFDASGTLVHEPTYQKQMEEGTWQTIQLSDSQQTSFSDFFLDAALKFLRPWLSRTTNAIAHKRKALETECLSLQGQFYGTKEGKKKRELLGTLLQQLDQLIALTGESRQRIVAWKIRTVTLKRLLDAEVESLPATPVVEETASTDRPIPSVKMPVKPTALSIMRQLKNMRQQFEPTQEKASSLQVKCKGAFDAEISILSLKTEDIARESLTFQVEFSRFVDTVERKGASLYIEMLLSEKNAEWQENCDQLRVFSERVSHEDYWRVIEKGDAQALEHLISQNPHFLVAPVQLNKGRETYPNLMQYCLMLAKTQATHPFLSACMAMLIRLQPQCLLTPVDEFELVSFVEWIQYQSNHPLYSLVLKSRIFSDVSTFVVLRDNLQRTLARSESSAHERTVIESKIAFYNGALKTLLGCPSLIGIDYSSLSKVGMDAWDEQVQLTLDEKMKLMTDPDYLAVMSQLMPIATNFLSKLSQLGFDAKNMQQSPELLSMIQKTAKTNIPSMHGWTFERKKDFSLQMLKQSLLPLQEFTGEEQMGMMTQALEVCRGKGLDMSTIMQAGLEGFMNPEFIERVENREKERQAIVSQLLTQVAQAQDEIPRMLASIQNGSVSQTETIRFFSKVQAEQAKLNERLAQLDAAEDAVLPPALRDFFSRLQ